ncbi:MAG: NAD-dependent epimerase/dehydratase family protein [Cellulosilyticaceae bacterium]
MQTILITGSSGFIGQHLVQSLSHNPELSLLLFDKGHTLKELSHYVAQADFIFHLAGVNRSALVDDFEISNVDLTRSLLSFMTFHKKSIPLIISSSIHATANTPYGKSKHQMEALVESFHLKNHCPTFIYRLPNVFGKWCRPNYNSVVATFCYNMAHGLPLSIHDPLKELTLLYIDDLINSFYDIILNPLAYRTLYITPTPTYTLTLGELAKKLDAFSHNRDSLLMPSLDTPFDQALYATYLSYIDDTLLSYHPLTHADDRGWLGELIKSDSFGQCFISYTKPGIIRGNHYHHTKTEKFIVLQGTARIKLRHIRTQDVIHYDVSGEILTIVDIPAGYTHSITNTGSDDLITLFWSSQIFDPLNPDTYFEEVEK